MPTNFTQELEKPNKQTHEILLTSSWNYVLSKIVHIMYTIVQVHISKISNVYIEGNNSSCVYSGYPQKTRKPIPSPWLHTGLAMFLRTMIFGL